MIQLWCLSTQDNLPQGPILKIVSFYAILLPQQKGNVGLGPLRKKILSKDLESRRSGILILTSSLPWSKLALDSPCNGKMVPMYFAMLKGNHQEVLGGSVG